MTTYTVTAGHGSESAEFRDCMEYLLTLFAAEQAALSAVHLHRRRTGACPPHLVEAALTRSEELARERESFRRRFFPTANRVVVGGDRVSIETTHGRLVHGPAGAQELVDELNRDPQDRPRPRLVHSS